ncbi:glycosyltransferase family 9 protein [Microbispora catharanthi]|uniref:Glycosyltransferase family 9 protein n=1 Tax=Microbispora catharanthi TaxID=1712871 RepID=A0A5N6C176_9ACTN|nr:glycosyltransferase family 9 protein [Microbispora catharanthi]KAB8186505.1 glycosyltransferase family 9 protein [Microbispora catharanthi]
MEHPAALAGPPVPWRGLARVLVIRPDNLGDVVMAGPALRALRRAAPRARLDLLAAPAGAAAAALLPEVDGVLTASVSWQKTGGEEVPVTDDLDLVDRIGWGGYEAAVILTSFSQASWPAAYLCRLAGVPVRVGMSKEFGGAGLTHWVPSPPDETHQVDRALHLLERAGVPPVEGRLRVRVPAEAASAARRLLDGRPGGDGRADGRGRRPCALILPGASCSARRYPADRFARVAGLLTAAGLRVLVAGTAREAPLVEATGAGVPGAVLLPGRLDVPVLAALIDAVDVVVCNNSGGAHLASALGTPVVVLFAGTEQVEQYRPRFGPASILTVPTACSPCRQFACPFALDCLDIPPEQVAAEALRLADERGGPWWQTPAGTRDAR